MKYPLILVFLGAGGLVCFIGYCFALIDWVQDVRTGVYDRHHFEAFYETSALVIYTVFGVRFIHRKLNIF